LGPHHPRCQYVSFDLPLLFYSGWCWWQWCCGRRQHLPQLFCIKMKLKIVVMVFVKEHWHNYRGFQICAWTNLCPLSIITWWSSSISGCHAEVECRVVRLKDCQLYNDEFCNKEIKLWRREGSTLAMSAIVQGSQT